MFSSAAANAATKTGSKLPSKVLVIVDLPDGDDESALPPELDARGLAGAAVVPPQRGGTGPR